MVEALSRVTHLDPRAVDGARAVAEGVTLLLEDPRAGRTGSQPDPLA